jgi:hypothetical protein
MARSGPSRAARGWTTRVERRGVASSAGGAVVGLRDAKYHVSNQDGFWESPRELNWDWFTHRRRQTSRCAPRCVAAPVPAGPRAAHSASTFVNRAPSCRRRSCGSRSFRPFARRRVAGLGCRRRRGGIQGRRAGRRRKGHRDACLLREDTGSRTLVTGSVQRQPRRRRKERETRWASRAIARLPR